MRFSKINKRIINVIIGFVLGLMMTGTVFIGLNPKHQEILSASAAFAAEMPEDIPDGKSLLIFFNGMGVDLGLDIGGATVEFVTLALGTEQRLILTPGSHTFIANQIGGGLSETGQFEIAAGEMVLIECYPSACQPKPFMEEPITQMATTTPTLVQSSDMTITETTTLSSQQRIIYSSPFSREVLVPTDIPDPAQVQDHFWFSRPFTRAFHSWGSYYYPYGTNANGNYLWHFGVDIASAHGQTIVAVGDGTVVYAGPDDIRLLGPWPDFYGQAVLIKHNQQWQEQPVYSLYGHVSKVLVTAGQTVQAGDPIAEVGQLGVATGPHLHLEIRLGGTTYDHTRNPDFWIRPDPGYGIVAGRVVDHQGYFVPQQLVTLHRAETAGRFWRQTYTYPDNQVNYDNEYAENFTFSDVPAGVYILKAMVDGGQLTIPITVQENQTAFALMKQTEPPRYPEEISEEQIPISTPQRKLIIKTAELTPTLK